MPGLIRGVARTAVIAGTATAVSNGVSKRQAERWSRKAAPSQQAYAAQPQQAPPPAPAPQQADDPMQKLQMLADLHAQGILTDEEFTAKKQQILAEI